MVVDSLPCHDFSESLCIPNTKIEYGISLNITICDDCYFIMEMISYFGKYMCWLSVYSKVLSSIYVSIPRLMEPT